MISLRVFTLTLFLGLGLMNDSFGRFHTIINFCGTTQGNGYNWASTLSWLSTELLSVYQDALEIQRQNPGAKVGISANCFIGGSSGSGVTAVYDSLLSNPNIADQTIGDVLIGRADPNRILSPEEIYRMSKSLRYIALGADLSFLFKVFTIRRVLGNNRNNLLTFGNGIDNVWGEQMGGKSVVVDFATYVHFAQYAPWGLINEDLKPGEGILRDFPITKFRNASVRAAFSRVRKMHDLIDLPEELARLENPNNPSRSLRNDLKTLGDAFEKISMSIRDEIHRTNNALYWRQGDMDYLFRRERGATPPLDNSIGRNPLQIVMEASPGNGIATISLGVPFENMEELEAAVGNKGFNYDDMKAYVFMSKETAEELLASSEYRRLVTEGDPAIQKFVIAVVDQKFAQVNPSVREPGLLDELAGDFTGNELRIQSVFDPTAPNAKNMQLQTPGKAGVKKSVFIIGGFPYEDLSSIPMGILQREKISKLEAHADNIVSRHVTFGVPITEENRTSTFAAKKVMSRLFNITENQSVAEGNFRKWEEWVASFEQRFRPAMEADGITIRRTKYNWNERKLPAALARISRVLVAKSHNATLEAMENTPTRSGPRTSELPSSRAFNPDYLRSIKSSFVGRCIDFLTSLIKAN